MITVSAVLVPMLGRCRNIVRCVDNIFNLDLDIELES